MKKFPARCVALIPELLRLRADFLVRRRAAPAVIGAAYREAVETSRRRGTRLYELSAATSLGRLLLAQGRGADARELVAPLYAWFTEAFDVPALVQVVLVHPSVPAVYSERAHI